MRRLLKYSVVLTMVVVLAGQQADAARWRFHFHHYSCPGGYLEVYGTLYCYIVTPPLFSGYAVECVEYSGWLPFWCNDYITIFAWDYWCLNVDVAKTVVPWYDWGHDRWEFYDLAEWVDANLTGPVVMPMVGDETGDIQEVYVLVNMEEWLADPRPIQEYYDIVDGECPDLPGYLIGTTPITFNENAPPTQSPFETIPLTGSLVCDGETTFVPSCPNPGASGNHCSADIYGEDCIVGLADLSQLLSNYGMATGATHDDGDIEPPPDGDGDVDLGDLAALLAQYNDDCN